MRVDEVGVHMEKRYFRIAYGVPGYRGAKEAIVAVHNDCSSTDEMAKVAMEKLYKALGEKVQVLRYNKLPSNYKAKCSSIIE